MVAEPQQPSSARRWPWAQKPVWRAGGTSTGERVLYDFIELPRPPASSSFDTNRTQCTILLRPCYFLSYWQQIADPGGSTVQLQVGAQGAGEWELARQKGVAGGVQERPLQGAMSLHEGPMAAILLLL